MIILSVIAIPLLLLEYFYTRERITEDVTQEYGDENKIPLKEQMKALFTNKYYVLLTIIVTVGSIVDNFKGGNVQYFYIKFLLGGADNPIMFTLYQVATGIPLGIGAFAIYPLAKKFGIKKRIHCRIHLCSDRKCCWSTEPIQYSGCNCGWLPAPDRYASKCLCVCNTCMLCL